MSESTVRIGLVLPDVMGTYGDGGNALILRQRLRMRGYDTLGADAEPVGRVTHGVGNGVGDGLEGVTQGSVIGTYMHGPVLARNPELADLLLKRALGVDELAPLDLPEVEQLRRERLRVR
ncbi:hypothetical protein AB4Z09_17145 [Rhodococcus sp. TAF43]|uniref:hypothetical protein n=1 Tax=Rhodococcus sp. TAF43 TaxID=3237483 RepID=UPI003F9E81BB